ncbi:MAG: hypothetical protein ABIH63_01865 [archaeon]
MEKKGEKLDLKKEERKPDELIIREGNISLILDSYDDIFSDFDPRPYEQKSLSDDFLAECKRAAEDKKTEVELRVLIPQNKRNLDSESKIKKRLRNHFQSHYKQKQEEKKRIRKKGIAWAFTGAILILMATLLYTQTYRGFIFILLFTLFEPAGWFTIWNGLEKIFIESREKVKYYKFYRIMSKTKVNFYGY